MPVHGIRRLINIPRRDEWERRWRGDLRGGLQAAAVALPMGLAFGVVSGFGPVAGLYSAVVTGIFAALFGGTATQISGPTGPIAIVMASIAATFVTEPAAVAGVILLAGALQILFGYFRFGRYISLLPYPVTSGFATAVGCIIIVMQLNPMIGLPPATDTVATVRSLATNAGNANFSAILIALACFAACRLMPLRLRRLVPVHLSVLVVGTAVVTVAGFDVPKLDTPDTLLPSFRLPPLTELPWDRMWLSAVVLALISSLDSLLTSLSADNATQTFHDPNRELVGQGLGNLCAALLGVLPGAGSTFRTMANIRGGGRTPLSAVFHALVIAVLTLTIGRLIGYIPSCVLAGILIYIGLGIIDWRYIRRFVAMPKTGVAIMVVTWVIALFVNVVTGAAIGIVIASLAFVKRMADLQMAELDIDDADEFARGLSDAESAALAASGGRTLLIRLGGPLAFGAANGLGKRLANVSGYQALVLDFTNVPDIDESGVIAFENVVRVANANGQNVLIAGLRQAVARPILRFGLANLLRSCQRFRSRIDALEAAAGIAARYERSAHAEY